MPCTVTDKIGYRSSAGVHTTIANLQVYAVPSSTAQTYDYAGTWRPNAARNPLIVGVASLDHGEVATTDATGTFTLVMPYATETHPLSPEAQWTIMFPDGQMVVGVVPSVAGPLTVDDLIQTYGWRWVSSVYIAPVTPGSLARGIATFSGGTDTASIVFGSPFVSAGYAIKLTISYDSGTLALPMYANKTTTGFDIKVTDSAFVGTVDWEAAL